MQASMQAAASRSVRRCVQGRYCKCSKEGPGSRGGMITGGQKQTSVWDANNTREQAGGRARRRVARTEGGGGGGGDGWRREREGWVGEMAGIRSGSARRRCRGCLRGSVVRALRLSQRKGKHSTVGAGQLSRRPAGKADHSTQQLPAVGDWRPRTRLGSS